MKQLLILVEGQTEELFISNVLNPPLHEFDLNAVPVLIRTGRTRQGSPAKGGFVNYQHAHNDLVKLLRDSSAVAVTTMVDFYALPANFPGLPNCPVSDDCYRRVQYLEHAWVRHVDHPRFLPFIMVHEFEALLFCDINAIAKQMVDPSLVAKLGPALARVDSPERINDGPNTHPSQRIRDVAPRYQKSANGPLIAHTIGLARMREQCPHFHSWVTKLEALGAN